MAYNLGCPVDSIKYDFEKFVGHVYVPLNCCVDMASTIKFFKTIDPLVGHIITWADGELDTQYVNHDGKWIAI